MDEIILNQHKYKVNLLSKTKQDTQFTYDISGGFKLKNGDGAPALLKVILHGNGFKEVEIKKEIKYLTEVSAVSLERNKVDQSIGWTASLHGSRQCGVLHCHAERTEGSPAVKAIS